MASSSCSTHSEHTASGIHPGTSVGELRTAAATASTCENHLGRQHVMPSAATPGARHTTASAAFALRLSPGHTNKNYGRPHVQTAGGGGGCLCVAAYKLSSSVLFRLILRLGATASGLGCASQEIGNSVHRHRAQQACKREARGRADLEHAIPHSFVETRKCLEFDLVQDHAVRHLAHKVDTRLPYSPAAGRVECALRHLQKLHRLLTPLQRGRRQLQRHFSDLPPTHIASAAPRTHMQLA